MGQLFWKFQLAFWAAIVFAFGLVFALDRINVDDKNMGRGGFSPQVRMLSQTAQQIVDAGGISLLNNLVTTWSHDPMMREEMAIVDASGQEISGRNIPAEAVAAARAIALVDKNNKSFQLLISNKSQFWPDRFRQARQSWELRMQQAPAEANAGLPKPPVRTPPFWFHPLFLLVSIVVASMASSFLLAWYFAAPVRQLHQALSDLPQQQWRTQLGPAITERRDEFGALGRSFNQMAQSVYKAILSQRRLLHDVSHELRSPLARLQILIGLVRQNPADLAAALSKVEAEAARLDQLVGEILTFSRLESGEVQLQMHPVALNELLESICDDAQLEAAAKQKQLQLTAVPSIVVMGDAEMLYRALENVIRNAIKYTGPDALVLVHCFVDAGSNRVRVQVDDDGPGVAPEQLNLLFNPFFRNHSNSDGVGLGLSIAKRAVEACAGHIFAENRVDHQHQVLGLRVVIELPLLQGSAEKSTEFTPTAKPNEQAV